MSERDALSEHRDAPTLRLRRQWFLVALCAAVAVAVGWNTLREFLDTPVARRWFLLTAVVLLFELWFLARNLDRNRTAEGALRDTLGFANALTLARGGLYAAVAGFILVPQTQGVAWIPGLCYGAGALLDWIDGRVATTVGRETPLGTKLDMAFDTLGFLVAPLVGVLWGRLPVWYLALSFARYGFKAARGSRRYRGRPVYELPESRVRRPLAAVQMAFISLALLPVVPVWIVRAVAAVVLLPSLAVFVRDYLVVSGRLRPNEP